MARRMFFVEAVRGESAWITGDDAHHLTRVLRVEPGQKYEISDNRNLYLAEVESARKNEVSFSILEKLSSPKPFVRITLFAALIRFERLEWMLEKATELGVESVQAFSAERSEKGLEAAARKRVERWRRIAREASEQSRRPRRPEIREALSTLPDAPATAHGYLLDESPDAEPVLLALPREKKSGDSVALCVGPEGGWTDEERAKLTAAGWKRVSLGFQILRAETAAIAALAVVNAAWQAAAVP